MSEIKERPILFSAPMVRAILAGQNMVTRRALKVQPHIDASGNFCVGRYNYGQDLDGTPMTKHFVKSNCPYGQPGDRLWVRESFWHAGDWVQTYPEDDSGDWCGTKRVHYRADGAPPNEPNHHYPNGLSNSAYSAANPAKIWRARPSIHMPRWASRILLEITSVRVERLQAITDEQAQAEGMVYTDFGMQERTGRLSVDGGKTFHTLKPQQAPGWHAGSNARSAAPPSTPATTGTAATRARSSRRPARNWGATPSGAPRPSPFRSTANNTPHPLSTACRGSAGRINHV